MEHETVDFNGHHKSPHHPPPPPHTHTHTHSHKHAHAKSPPPPPTTTTTTKTNPTPTCSEREMASRTFSTQDCDLSFNKNDRTRMTRDTHSVRHRLKTFHAWSEPVTAMYIVQHCRRIHVLYSHSLTSC